MTRRKRFRLQKPSRPLVSFSIQARLQSWINFILIDGHGLVKENHWGLYSWIIHSVYKKLIWALCSCPSEKKDYFIIFAPTWGICFSLKLHAYTGGGSFCEIYIFNRRNSKCIFKWTSILSCKEKKNDHIVFFIWA